MKLSIQWYIQLITYIKSAYHYIPVSWSDKAPMSPKRILNVAQVYRIVFLFQILARNRFLYRGGLNGKFYSNKLLKPGSQLRVFTEFNSSGNTFVSFPCLSAVLSSQQLSRLQQPTLTSFAVLSVSGCSFFFPNLNP